MRLLTVLFTALYFVCVPVRLAFAGEASVTLPIGDWIAALVGLINQIATPIILLIVAWAGRVLPAALVSYLNMVRVDQLLERAVGYALNAVSGAAAGRVLEVDVGNKVLATALNYAVEHAPALVKWAGGVEGLSQKIIARLSVEAAGSVQTSATGRAYLS